MSKLAFVTVIYNMNKEYMEKSINSTIEAIKKNPSTELMLIDNGSTKSEVWEYIQQFENQERITVHKINENKGKSPAIAFAIENLKSDYFQVVDPDDWIDSSKVEKIINLLEQTNGDIYVLPYTYYNNQKNTYKKRQLIKTEKEIIKLDKFPLFLWNFDANTIRSRKAFIENNFKMPEKFEFFEDVYINAFILDKTKNFYFLNINYFNYRIKQSGKNISSFKKLAQKYENFHTIINSEAKNLNFNNTSSSKYLVYHFSLQITAYIYLKQFSEKKVIVPKTYSNLKKEIKNLNPELWKKLNIFNFKYFKLGRITLWKGWNFFLLPTAYIISLFRS